MRFFATTLLATAVASFAVPASAADIPVKAPIAVAAAAYNWNGFYLGGNVGYSFGRVDGGQNIFVPPGSPPPDTPFKLNPTGWLAGGQIGVNWQAGRNWILGVEADWQWMDQRRTTDCITPGGAGPCIPGVLLLTVESSIRSFATLRGRIGYAHDRWLFYVTGGGAWADVRETDVLAFATFPRTVSFSQTKSGWTAGGGIEAALGGNWTAKLEYLHLDLGSTSNSFSPTGSTAIQTVNLRNIRDEIVRIGLNYRFGWSGPVVARY